MRDVGGEERSRFRDEDCLRAVLNKVFYREMLQSVLISCGGRRGARYHDEVEKLV